MSADREDGLIAQVGAEDQGGLADAQPLADFGAAAAPVPEPRRTATESDAAASPAPDAELAGSRADRIRALRRRHTITVLALSCAVFALAAAAFAWTTTRSHDRAERAEERLHTMSRLLGAGDVERATTAFAGTATLTAYYSPTHTSILIAATGLPNPPQGRAYELWYTNAATLSPLARFTTLADITTLTRPATGPATLLLTLEPADGAPRQPAPPIATLVLAG